MQSLETRKASRVKRVEENAQLVEARQIHSHEYTTLQQHSAQVDANVALELGNSEEIERQAAMLAAQKANQMPAAETGEPKAKRAAAGAPKPKAAVAWKPQGGNGGGSELKAD